ncbi:hypothetical protein EV122DRAFT_285335 [Schizophyllum commune]
MDTFVNRRSVLDVASTLENLDYRYVPDVLPLRTIAEAVDYKADSSTFNSSVVGVHVFRHSSGKRIVVHVARTSTVDCILRYGTSALMNFVSHTSAYALYPKGTLIDRRALFLAPPPWMGVPDDHHSKRAYGYKNTAQVTRLTASRAAHEWGRKFRYVGDDLTCKISLLSATDILDGAMHQSWKLCFRRINRCECGEGRLLQAPYMGRKRVTIPPLRDCANFHYVFADQQFLEAFDDVVQNMRWSHEVWTGVVGSTT